MTQPRHLRFGLSSSLRCCFHRHTHYLATHTLILSTSPFSRRFFMYNSYYHTLFISMHSTMHSTHPFFMRGLHSKTPHGYVKLANEGKNHTYLRDTCMFSHFTSALIFFSSFFTLHVHYSSCVLERLPQVRSSDRNHSFHLIRMIQAVWFHLVVTI